MKKIHLSLFFLSFILISVIEGIHFILDLRFLTFFLYLIPFFLFFSDSQKEYKMPTAFLYLAGIYLFSSLISLFYSKEIGMSLELFLRDVSLFLILFYSHSHAIEIQKQLPKIIVWVSLLFIVVSAVLFMFPEGRLFIQGQRLNFLFNPAYLHKTIGDYFTLGIIISSYFLFVKKDRWYTYPLILFIVILLISFSRTAYITLAVISIVFFIIHGRNFKKISPILQASLFFNIILVIVLFLTFVSKTETSILTFAQKSLDNSAFINVRPLLESHMTFWIAGFKGFLLAPFTGTGAGTFSYLSYRFMDTLFLSSFTSFNIIIDLLAEQGLVPTLSFLLMIFYIGVKAKKDSVFFLLFLVLVIEFMGYSIYKYIQILLLFFVVMGIMLPTDTHNSTIQKRYFLPISLIAIIFINILFVHTLLIQFGRRDLAHYIYPFDSSNIKVLVQESLSHPVNNRKTDTYLKQYVHYFSSNANDLEFIGDSYREMGGRYKLDAIHAYEQSFLWGKYAYGGNLIDRMAKLYALKQQIQGGREASRYMSSFMASYFQILDRDPRIIQQEIYKKLEKTYFPE